VSHRAGTSHSPHDRRLVIHQRHPSLEHEFTRGKRDTSAEAPRLQPRHATRAAKVSNRKTLGAASLSPTRRNRPLLLSGPLSERPATGLLPEYPS
jgi:hypothetical protein